MDTDKHRFNSGNRFIRLVNARFFAMSSYLCPSVVSIALFRFNPSIAEEPLSELDCNQNGEDDTIDILTGTSLDDDENGVPDECAIRLSIAVSQVRATTTRKMIHLPSRVTAGRWLRAS